MKRLGKAILTLPVWLPLMFVGAVCFEGDIICSHWLTIIGDWISK
jgi:hypothetical protein